MMKRLAMTLVVVAAAFGCTDSEVLRLRQALDAAEKKAAVPAAAPCPVPFASATAAATASQPAVSLSGTGRTGLAGPFALQAGARRFTATHAGTGNFQVTLKTGAGAYTKLLFNDIGQASAPFAYFVTASGQYYADVEADGAWTLKAE